MNDIWQTLREWLHNDESAVLITVVDVHGSSPGKTGFKMAVSSSGQTAGTIGGGPMEYSMTRLALERLGQGKSDPFIKKQVHASDAGADASGLICAGEQTHAFVTLHPNDAAMPDMLIKHQEEAGACILRLSPDGMEVLPHDASMKTGGEWTMADEGWAYREIVTTRASVYIFGGGHLSLPLSQICSMLGFRVIVLDDRQHLETMRLNDRAHRKIHADFSRAASYVANPDNAYVCIMTVSHASDKMVLEQFLPLPVKYLGMIGSKNKIRSIFAALRDKGIDSRLLGHVDSPMGIDIRAETPAEIAVSIAAEMVRVKNSG